MNSNKLIPITKKVHEPSVVENVNEKDYVIVKLRKIF